MSLTLVVVMYLESRVDYFSSYISHLQEINQKSTLDFSQFLRSLRWLDPTLVPPADKTKALSSQHSLTEGTIVLPALVREIFLHHEPLVPCF